MFIDALEESQFARAEKGAPEQFEAMMIVFFDIRGRCSRGLGI